MSDPNHKTSVYIAYKQNFKLLAKLENDWDEIEFQFDGNVELLMSQIDDQDFAILKMQR